MCDRSLVIVSASSPRRPVVVDLFSGAGGLSLGFESAGFDIVSAIEYDPVHAAVHLFNFPLTDVLCRDISELSKSDILDSVRRGYTNHYPGESWDGVVDAIVGGPSCQGFSTMGKQDADDDRNQLLLQFVRVVEEIRPLSFCMENVPGLLDPRFDSIRAEAVDRLVRAGYSISGEDRVLRAEDFGVPQKRRRVVILGALGDEAPPRPVGDAKHFNVGDAFAGLPAVESASARIDGDRLRLTTREIGLRSATANEYLLLANTLGRGDELFGHARLFNESVLGGCRMTKHSDESARRFALTAAGTKEPVSRLHRLSSTEPALTLRAGTGRERGAFSAARPIHPTSPRVVTVREAARLHSFPDWFRFHTTNWHGHRQIGNAVPPLLARAAGLAIMRALGRIALPSDRPPIALESELLLSLNPTEAAQHFEAPTNQVPKRRRDDTKPPLVSPVAA